MAIQFNLKKVETLQFAIIAKEDVKPPINLQTSIGFAFSTDKKVIRCSGDFVYDKDGATLMKLQVACYFEIAEESLAKMKNEKGKYVIPVFFQQHLATIMVGTARGILHEKTADTFMNKYFLPLLNLTKMIERDIEI